MSRSAQFDQLTSDVLNAPIEAGVIKPMIDNMSAILQAVAGVSPEDDINALWNNDKQLTTGVAISPVQAAKCLKEYLRTQIFLKGIHKAILDKLDEHETVTILYAGSGPYGTLLIPLLPLFSSHRVRVTIIDIHQENIEAIQKVTDWMGVSEYIDEFCILDACAWQPTSNTPSCFDLLVSETMNAFLKREPQVTIFSHLAQFLKSDGDLIPQVIGVEAWLNHSVIDSNSGDVKTVQKSEKLAELIKLDRELADKIRTLQLTKIEKQLHVPEYVKYYDQLHLRTHITVYREFNLGLHQSSLNAAMQIGKGAIQANSTIHCCYHISNEPDWEFKYKGYFDDLPLRKGIEAGRLGIKQLPRYWDKYRRLPFTQALQSSDKEWEIERKLLEVLGVRHEESVAFIQSTHPELSEFEDWLKLQSSFPTREVIEAFNEHIAQNVT